MDKITKFGMKNFRVFKEMHEIEFAPITVLTGKNNSGKSSVIKALMLLSENKNLLKLDFSLGQKKHNLVSFENILNDNDKELVFSLTTDGTSFYEYHGEETTRYRKVYFFKEGELNKIKFSQIFNDKKNHTIIDYNKTLTKENFIDVNWFWQIIKKRLLILPALTSDHKKFERIKDYLSIFPKYLGEDFFTSKLKDFDKKHVENFIKEFHSKLLLLLTYDDPDCIKISLFDLEKMSHFELDIDSTFINDYEFNKVKNIFFHDKESTFLNYKEVQKSVNNSKYADILSVVGDISILDIYDKYKLIIIHNNIRAIIDMYIKSILWGIKFDFMEFNKTNFEHVYTSQTDNTAFAEILKTYFDYNIEKRLKKERKIESNNYEQNLKDYNINKKIEKQIIDELDKKGYKTKELPYTEFLLFDIVPDPGGFANLGLNISKYIILIINEKEKEVISFINIKEYELKEMNTETYEIIKNFLEIILNEYENNGYKTKEVVTLKEYKKYRYNKTRRNLNLLGIKIFEEKKEAFWTIKKPELKFSETEKELNYINYWLGKDGFDIGEKILIEKTDYATVIKILRNGREINIADLGTGTNQILALILKIMSSKNNMRLILEEPEVNLHPSFQSKLADLIVDAKKGIKTATFLNKREFIIETHSEYFIRRLQYLVAKKVIKPEDVAIYYFNDPKDLKEGEKQIVKLEIREDGMMDKDFGTGFFDESSKLTMDLLKIQNLS